MYTYQIYIFLSTHTILLSNMINYIIYIYIYIFINFNQFKPIDILCQNPPIYLQYIHKIKGSIYP